MPSASCLGSLPLLLPLQRLPPLQPLRWQQRQL